MSVNRAIFAVLAVAIMSATTVARPAHATATSPSLSITASSSAASAHSELTFAVSGTAVRRSVLELYALDSGVTASCPVTADEADNPNAAEFVVAAGSFSETGGIELDPATYIVCGYLMDVSASFSDPPAAAATSGQVTVVDGTGTCPSGLSATVTNINFVPIGRSQAYSGADLIVHTSMPGKVDAMPADESNHNLGSGELADEGSDNYLVQVYDTFNRSRSHADTAVFEISFEPDADLGCNSPKQKLTITFYADTLAYDVGTQGGGGVATFGGQTVPGSEPSISDPSPSPVIRGTHQVGSAATCSLTVPRGNYVAVYAWYVGSTKVGTEQSYTIAPADYGKPLRCTVVVSSDDGTTTSSGQSVTAPVKEGPAVKNKLRPEILGNSSVGHAMHVVSKASFWSPKPTSYTYQWYAGSKRIAGATGKRYRIAPSVGGKRLYCRVTAHATGYAPGTATTYSRDIPA